MGIQFFNQDDTIYGLGRLCELYHDGPIYLQASWHAATIKEKTIIPLSHAQKHNRQFLFVIGSLVGSAAPPTSRVVMCPSRAVPISELIVRTST
jgi:hypothetical protein